MAAPGIAHVGVTLDEQVDIRDTDALLSALLRANDQVSDLLFSPGRPPQVEVHGRLLAVRGPRVHVLTADDTRRVAADLIGSNKQAITILREQGSCDVSYAIPGLARFRVHCFIQRGSCAVVMRVIPTVIPTLETLGLPAELAEIADLQDGIVLVTGLRGSGKSSTLAAILDCINRQRVCHIITIEEPIEFLHNHKLATIHQRELQSDVPNTAMAMRAAARQSPDVILVSELRDRETIESALDAAETGHLVLSTLNTQDANQTVERLLGSFPVSEQEMARSRLTRTIRSIVSQRLVPRRDGPGRRPEVEIVKDHPGLSRTPG